ncbi:DUF1642 domain-containing protein [Streptococcus ferus]|uniref:DUF1642 domain-containing protein n=1 Tax=Streptococcus ferus TaxID=1345 RepID=UPI003515FB2D
MNKEEAIQELQSQARHHCGEIECYKDGCEKSVELSKAIDIISKIDEPQKVVVPKFVAEYIEYCKHDKFYALHGAYATMDDKLKHWRFKGNNSELFAKAWLYGYEIESEKLYTVKIPNPNRKSFLYALHRKDDGKIIIVVAADNYEEIEGYQLTESEIKQDFEWAWQFAKEVE